MNWLDVLEQIESATGIPVVLDSVRPIDGGDINRSYCLEGDGHSYFVKFNRVASLNMFAAEEEGLRELAASETVRVPSPIVHGLTTECSFIAMEFIEFGATCKAADKALGEQLAALHMKPQAFFGWHRNNTIGSTPQPNTSTESWVEFWRTQRLQYQLNLAAESGYKRGALQNAGAQLCERLDAFFTDYQPQPSMLHGDLWGGNTATDKHGNPYIYDPACYYGDRETDIAMTELFGGFNTNFYTAYNAVWPLDAGYKTRKKLYNLYHILNHLNLFGSSYLSQAERMIADLLSELN